MWTYFAKSSKVLRLTFTDRIALLYLLNASSFVSIDISFLLAEDFTVAYIPLLDRTPVFGRDERTLATFTG
jgi:hypothetical protein